MAVLSRYDAIVEIGQSLWRELGHSDRIYLLFDHHLLKTEPEEIDDDYPQPTQQIEITDEDLYDIYSLIFRGVKNSYLEYLLFNHKGNPVQVVGTEEALCACDCCGFKTLREDSVWDICPACNWQDVESRREVYSFVNKSTLSAAKIQFLNDREQVQLAEMMYSR